MDEQRVEAYNQLITRLLDCPQGEELGLLQANAALVDAGLLEMMEQVAAQLEDQGNPNARWLREFRAQLAQPLGTEMVDATETGKAAQFLLETLQLIADTDGNSQQIYPVWAQQLTHFNEELLAAVSQAAAQLLAGATEHRTFVATVLVTFGNRIQQFPLGTRWLNLELGIAAYHQSLTVITEVTMPVEWATITNNLAIVYTDRIQGDRAENIEQAIALYEQALTVRTKSATPVEWADTTNDLANAYTDRIRGDRAENIEQAISFYQQSLMVRTKSATPVDWADTMNNLAIAYANRIRGDQAENIEQAITAYQQSLMVRTKSAMPVEWARTIMNLAIVYTNRIRGDRAENIEQAITFYQQSLTVMTKSAMPVDWATTMMNLASTYHFRIRGDRAENIEQAISFYQQSLTIRTQATMPVGWAKTMMGLANAYSHRIRGDRAENIEQAITFYQQSLTVMTKSAMPVDWAETMMNLAVAYDSRIRGDRAENIEQAISAFQQSLTVRTKSTMPMDWAKTTMNLATAYSFRIRGDRAENIEQAITFYQRSLTVMTRSAIPVEWARTMMNLAVAYDSRIRGDRAENIEQAITAYEQALTVRTKSAMPVDWAETMLNLATAYYFRIRGDRAENIEQAITANEQALTVRTKSTMPVEWAQTMMNLAITYFDRIRGDRAENIEQAINAYEQSLTVMTRSAMPVEWAQTMMNLAIAYKNRIRGDRAENIEQTITAYEQSLSIFTPDLLPDDCRRTARSLANLHLEQSQWIEAATVYTIALQAAENLYQSANLLDSRSAELSENVDLFRNATYAYARTGDFEQAIETLEQNRARGLSESLNRDRTDLTQLQQLKPDLYNQYQVLIQALRNLESEQRDRAVSSERHQLTPEKLRDNAISLRQQLDQLIQNIRQVPSYQNFLTLPKFAEVRQFAQHDRPLVYLTTTFAGSLALLVTPDNIDAIWLNNFTDNELIDLLKNTWFAAYDQSQNDRQSWHDAIDSVTRQLWEPLMEPLIRHLQTQNVDQAVLIPTGYLSLLPLHASWTEDSTKPTGRRYALDDIHFTYTPNAKSLTAAQAIAARTPADTILAIDNPRNDLPNSEREVQAAIKNFPQRTVLRHAEATIEEVRLRLSNASIVHFSCHGTANLNDPLNSGLLMSDGLLTLRDILALNLSDHGGIRLAILSACETGLSGIENADEAISLPTGLLQAGVAGVMASLWSVSDLSTMLLLTKFYDLWREQNLPPDQALRQAQIWLRDTTNEEKIAEFKTFIPAIANTRMSPTTAQQLYDELAWETKNERSFAHPFHWAAFNYTGI
ncbi:CHAT domain-containing tetratricopeptide repeat protein [Leptolyngbya sp. AN10]|uniref:CHAT domain-containing tetratricopeptide repeat protein n=1 Tax=Leptolyngbya sp. AN10 TaxID=3423365 RepID=UPI003D31F689